MNDAANPLEHCLTSKQCHPLKEVRWIDPDRRVLLAGAGGDIDVQRSGDFHKALVGLLNEKPSTILVDLSGVTYMDSSGIASLVKVLARTGREKVGLRLCCLPGRVRSIFELTRLDTIFKIFPTQQEALKE